MHNYHLCEFRNAKLIKTVKSYIKKGGKKEVANFNKTTHNWNICMYIGANIYYMYIFPLIITTSHKY